MLHLAIRLPYSWWQTGSGLMRPDKNGVPVYIQALKKELASLGADMTEHTVDTVHFEGGYMGLLLPDDFTDLMATIHSSFHLAADAEVSGTLFPGSLDMALISTYQNYHAGPLMFEIPSLLMRECERYQLPNVLQLLDHTCYILQSYRQPDWGLSLARGIPGRTPEVWAHIAKEALHYQPAHIAFFDIAPRGDDGFSACAELLLARGYRAVTPDFYTRAARAPRFLLPGDSIGAGLGAESRTDGFYTRNTDDLKRYLNSCGDYRNLLVQVREEA